ncbi:MAG: hypothetical protein PUH86_04695 [Lachnospiraceae bacterium]|nr:hypothetical protein [Lachnospiraceae bacterium]
MEDVKYYWERSYPYIFSTILFLIMYRGKINFAENSYMNDAIDGVNTITSLIIGFLGAILPVILGMKNESKFVQYVFENDKNKLFLKYIRENILVGLLLLFISVGLYFRKEEVLKGYIAYGFYIWSTIIVLFLLVTYRCLSNMLNLIFSSDKALSSGLYNESEEDKIEREMIQHEFSDKNVKGI